MMRNGVRKRETELVQELIEALRDPSPATRESAARSLKHFGPRAVAAIPALMQASKDDPSHSVRLAVELAIDAIDPLAVERLDYLERHPDDDDGFPGNDALGG